MTFLIDNQLPPALARYICAELGSEAWHVADVGPREASDADVWQYASANGFVLVSKDAHGAEELGWLPHLGARR